MPFEGSQILVRVSHTIVPREDMPLEKQIALTEYALTRQFAGNKDLHINVEKVDVYSADYDSSKREKA